MDLQEKYDRLDMNYDNLKEELEKVKKNYINSERAADAYIEKLEKENKELKEENKKLQNKLNKLKKIYVSKHMEEEIERLISE